MSQETEQRVYTNNSNNHSTKPFSGIPLPVEIPPGPTFPLKAAPDQPANLFAGIAAVAQAARIKADNASPSIPVDASLNSAALNRARLEAERTGYKKIAPAALDPEAQQCFTAIQAEYERHIFNYLNRVLGNKDDAQDLTQETFLRAYQAFSRYTDNGKVKPWLFRIATNICLDELRHHQIIKLQPWESFMSAFDPKQVAWDNPERVVLQKESAERVRNALDKLSPRYRLALILREYAELSCKEIAAVLKTSRGAAKSLLFRARQEFKIVFQQLDQAGTVELTDILN